MLNEKRYSELLMATFFRIIKTVWMILKIKSYLLIAISVTLGMATVIPILTLVITRIWIYNATNSSLLPLSLTRASYLLSGVFVALLIYSKRVHTYCRSGRYTGITGTVLSAIGCCSPVIYVLFIIGLISSAITPFLTLIPSISILLLGIAICLLANIIGKNVG